MSQAQTAMPLGATKPHRSRLPLDNRRSPSDVDPVAIAGTAVKWGRAWIVGTQALPPSDIRGAGFQVPKPEALEIKRWLPHSPLRCWRVIKADIKREYGLWG